MEEVVGAIPTGSIEDIMQEKEKPKPLDLTVHPEDDDYVRALKRLLTYGDHKEGCDRSNEEGPRDVQHLCCECDWCNVADGAYMSLLFHPSTPNK